MSSQTISMHYCAIFRLAYILSMLVSWISCHEVPNSIKICNKFPNMFESQSITVACGYSKTGLHYIHHSPFKRSLYRDECHVFNVSWFDPVECAVYAGRDDNVDPKQNPTFTAFDPPTDKVLHHYNYAYLLQQDGVYCWNLETKEKGYASYQTWRWPVKYEIIINNQFSEKEWVHVYCKLDKWNAIQKIIYSGFGKVTYGDSKPLSFVVNMSPDEQNEIPCQVDWHARSSKYSSKRYSFFALNKRWFQPHAHHLVGYRSVTLHWLLRDDGVYLWIPNIETFNMEEKVESWRESGEKSPYDSSSATKVKTSKLFNLRGWKFSQLKTKYITKTWDQQYYEYSSAYNLKTLYCISNTSLRLCQRQQ